MPRFLASRGGHPILPFGGASAWYFPDRSPITLALWYRGAATESVVWDANSVRKPCDAYEIRIQCTQVERDITSEMTSQWQNWTKLTAP
jgi:hypothetical protein